MSGSNSRRVETGPPNTAVGPADDSITAEDLGAALGSRATLVQFSSAFCAPCRTTRTLSRDVARLVPGVEHVDIDAEENLGLTRRVGIERTPTVLIVDAAGRIRNRVTGAPSRVELLAALAEVM